MSLTRWLLVLVPAVAAGGVFVGRLDRARHERHVDALWAELRRAEATETFAPEMVAGLPAPARRYLLRALAPGAPLARSVRLEMRGTIRLDPDAEPLAMEARQILAPPHGFVWQARVAEGAMRIRGFDRYGGAQGAMRWWLYGLLPVVRADGPDVTRSAAGRLAGEAVLLPEALLPGRGARWEGVDEHSARVTLEVDGEAVTSTLTVDVEGRLERVQIQRWNSDRAGGPGYEPFVVDRFADERTVQGHTVPTRFRAGWRLGRPDAFPFFHARIDTASYQ